MEETKSVIPRSNPETSRLPLSGWALELARRWNAGTYSMFILHGNIFDLFPVHDGQNVNYVPLKTFLSRRLFPEREFLLFYDIGDGLSFGSAEMQKRLTQRKAPDMPERSANWNYAIALVIAPCLY